MASPWRGAFIALRARKRKDRVEADAISRSRRIVPPSAPTDRSDGIPVGEYVVTIIQPNLSMMNQAASAPNQLPARFGNAKTSGNEGRHQNRPQHARFQLATMKGKCWP